MSGELTGFFYGTLMAPEVFFSVCYGTKSPPAAVQALHAFVPAVLAGFCRHRVRAADYPGIVSAAGGSVRGVYVTGLTTANMQKLDDYEGSEYRLETVRVRLDDDEAAERETRTYVFLHPKELEAREWDFEEFKRDRMKLWTRNGYCEGDMKEWVQ
ncbi:disease resistance protein Aig2, putative [Cordyceps militaris CM01]|uniref:Putative gamma-glutamylcyclotransferase n=2 Tax=Cordyceps militaris TaxID=73501 RepID=G3J9I9_CORMM|nr:disease resistance protein Aig2, putative [Cordyceps militaris CM01]ATY60773.1 disease resistance [Cordyceps militaris]EGX94966.1 disease resistance protein Aig2, putative [Cordyceps militaris CM01]